MIQASSLFSQSGLRNEYPKIVIINSDTLIAITKKQRDKANIVKVERDYYKEYSDSLNSAVEGLEIALIDCRTFSESLQNEVNLNGRLNKHQRELVKTLLDGMKQMDLEILSLKELNRYLWAYSVFVTVLFVIVVIL